ncbi:hypothetical protein LTR37_014396 [Vermiconidia calcicola]|uniref:Uncharacterized protein n=1 Tax=Vermiconidia calcicola TaxID=1690605 RepID=A0ACC3MV87_9PEZI|nr:hypothetical protein LTR37_014396 [Vermiconidia calcicola]
MNGGDGINGNVTMHGDMQPIPTPKSYRPTDRDTYTTKNDTVTFENDHPYAAPP